MLKTFASCLLTMSVLLLSELSASAEVVFSEDFESYNDAQSISAGENPNGWAEAASVSFDRFSDPPTNLVADTDINGPGIAFDVPDGGYYPYNFFGQTPWQVGQASFAGGAISGGTAKLSFEINPFSSSLLGVVLRDPVSGHQVEAINSNAGMHLSVNADAKEFIGDYGASNPGEATPYDNAFFTEVNMDLTNSTVSLTVRSTDPVNDPTGFTPDPATTATFALPAGFSPSQVLLIGEVVGGSGPGWIDNVSVDHIPGAALEGDLNDDEFVGQDDLNIILSNWGQMPPADERADPSGDGFVGQDDLNPVLTDWGQGTPPALGAVSAVPEPNAVLLLAIGAMAAIPLLRNRWRQK